MKIYMMLIALFLTGCAGQSSGLTQEEGALHLYYEELETEYENLGRIVATSRYNHARDALKKVLGEAVALGADGVIIQFSGNQDGAYRIQATAMRYIQ